MIPLGGFVLRSICASVLLGSMAPNQSLPNGDRDFPKKTPTALPFLMRKTTISMVIFNSYVKLPEGICLGFGDIVAFHARVYACS